MFFDDYSFSAGSVGELVIPGIDLTNATDPILSLLL